MKRGRDRSDRSSCLASTGRGVERGMSLVSKVGDGGRELVSFSEGDDVDFFEEVDVEFEEDVSSDFVFW